MAGWQKTNNYKKLNKPDYSFMLVVFALLAFGLIMVFSASSATAHYQFNDVYYFIKKQFMWACFGVGAMFFMSRISYKTIYKYAGIILGVSVVMLLAVFVLGTTVNGAKRWLGFGLFSIQPSEIAKIALVIFLSKSLSMYKKDIRTFKKGFLTHNAVILIIAALVFFEPHLSGAIVIVLSGTIVMIAAGARIKYYVFSMFAVIPVLIVAVTSASYRMERVMSFLDPFKYASGEGWQIVQSLYAIGSGGFFGMGLGQSRQKFLYLPEPQNDFIFSVICEELGFIGAILVIALFAVLVFKGIKIAMNAPDMFSSLVVIGIMALIAIQVILNIAVVTSSIPPTGIPLPFFSYGGTSLMLIMAQMGIVLSISRESEK